MCVFLSFAIVSTFPESRFKLMRILRTEKSFFFVFFLPLMLLSSETCNKFRWQLLVYALFSSFPLVLFRNGPKNNIANDLNPCWIECAEVILIVSFRFILIKWKSFNFLLVFFCLFCYLPSPCRHPLVSFLRCQQFHYFGLIAVLKAISMKRHSSFQYETKRE